MTKNSTYLENFDERLPLSVVAEVSANHDGSFETAKKIIDLASRAGANAVKFQTFTPDSISLDSQEDDFLLPVNSPWERFGSFHKLYSKSYTPREWHKELFNYTKSLGLIPFPQISQKFKLFLRDDVKLQKDIHFCHTFK